MNKFDFSLICLIKKCMIMKNILIVMKIYVESELKNTNQSFNNARIWNFSNQKMKSLFCFRKNISIFLLIMIIQVFMEKKIVNGWITNAIDGRMVLIALHFAPVIFSDDITGLNKRLPLDYVPIVK